MIADEIKGMGVETTKKRKKGDYICEYSGELITFQEAQQRESIYSKDCDIGCYMYYFEYKNVKYWLV